MLRNADISYSSIAASERNDPCCTCCFLSCHLSMSSCCRCCILRLPYGTITASLFTICGLVVGITALFHSTSITERLFLELLNRKYLWFNDLKVSYVIATVLLAAVILINLTIGFATTGKDDKDREGCCRRNCCCGRGAATGCVVKTIFFLNYILFYAIFTLTILSAIALFLSFTMSQLCNDGRHVHTPGFVPGRTSPTNAADDDQQIDLRQFSPLMGMMANETQLLMFKGPRLKKLCVDYVGGLMFYVLLVAVGFVFMTIGFVNFLINLSVNWVRRSTKIKYQELFLINGAEMVAFGESPALSTRHNLQF